MSVPRPPDLPARAQPLFNDLAPTPLVFHRLKVKTALRVEYSLVDATGGGEGAAERSLGSLIDHSFE